MSLELRKLFVDIAKEAYDRGFVSASGGNISARIRGTTRIIIKPTGMRLKDLSPEDLVVMDLDGTIISGKGKPSIEHRFHRAIYRIRDDVNAVIHTHSPNATVFAVIEKELPLLTAQASKILKRVPSVDYAPPGSERLATLVEEAFKDREIRAVLLKRHGTITVGKDLKEAFNLADLLEETAKIAIAYFQLKRSFS